MRLITVMVDLPMKRETQEKKALAAEVEHVRNKPCILGQRAAKSKKYSWPWNQEPSTRQDGRQAEFP